MVYEKEEILQYVIEEDVKFIRMTFCDVMGRLKNVSIMPDELDRAFAYGISIDASAIAGFGGEVHSDLVLRPDASTLCILPWRPEHGRVVRMFCSVYYPDGRPFEMDTRAILANAVKEARSSFISSGWTIRELPQRFRMTRPDTWTLRRRIRVKMCAARRA